MGCNWSYLLVTDREEGGGDPTVRCEKCCKGQGRERERRERVSRGDEGEGRKKGQWMGRDGERERRTEDRARKGTVKKETRRKK